MQILVTGAAGFIAKNLISRLQQLNYAQISIFTRQNTQQELTSLVAAADFIYHLAGVNRTSTPQDFAYGNHQLTARLCQALIECGRATPLVFSSSQQVALNNAYGKSKLQAEDQLKRLNAALNNSVIIYRLANVFGQGCRPNYNSVVATFCHNLAHDLALPIDNAANVLHLCYIDDVVTALISCLQSPIGGIYYPQLATRQISVGELALRLQQFKLLPPAQSDNLTRALYATYKSYWLMA